MYCHKCGTALPPGSQFCPACGVAVPDAVHDAFVSGSGFPTATVLPGHTDAGIGGVASATPRPWIRYWARMLDVMLFAVPAGMVIAFLAPHLLTEGNEFALGFLLLLMWVFVEPLCLVVFDTTPGRWLLRTRVVLRGGEITYGQALSRSLKVWWRGLAMGVPFVSLFTMWHAYRKLGSTGQTSWDSEGGFAVVHAPVGMARGLGVVALMLLYLIFIGAASV